MNIYPWQQELLDNPPRASQLYSPEEWEDIVLNELFEPNTMKGEAHPLYGKKLSDETKKRMSEARKGKPKSEEHKKKISGEGNPFYGKKHSEETRKRIAELSAERAKGERNPMYGKKHSEETKKKMSETKKGVSIIQPKQKQVECPHCNKRGALNAMNRLHFDNCKLFTE